MAGIGNYKKGKAFQLKSGNNPTFKMMGSSPLKMHDGTKSTTTHYSDGSPKSEREVDFSERHEGEVKNSKTTIKKMQPGLENPDKDAAFDKMMNNKDWMPGPPKPPPSKPKTGSGADSTEGQDQNKIFDDSGNHIGNWKGDKKVLFKSSPAKRADVYIDGENVGTGEEAMKKGVAQEKKNIKVGVGVDAATKAVKEGNLKEVTYDKEDAKTRLKMATGDTGKKSMQREYQKTKTVSGKDSDRAKATKHVIKKSSSREKEKQNN